MLENILLDQLSKKLGRKVEADECSMNQFSGEIHLRNLRVYNEAGTEVQINLEEGHAKLNMLDLMKQKVTIEHASVDSLHISR